MEIDVIEDKKNKAVIKIKDVNHTICNLLKEELWKDGHIKNVSYSIEHPLIKIPQFIVETDGKKTPKAAFSDAVKKIKKTLEKFEKDFKKEVK